MANLTELVPDIKISVNQIFGINTELKHAPVRFHFTYNHLNKWKIILT